MALNAEQQQKLQAFQELTQINDSSLCTEILQQNNWDVNAAVDNFMHGRVSNAPTSSASVNRRRPQTTGSSPPSNANSQRNGGTWNPLKWIFQTRQSSLNTTVDTQKFIDEFDADFGVQHPTFAAGSYQTAVQQAYRDSKFLLVYIHSPMHDETAKFCHQALCTEGISRFINENMIMWAGSVWHPEAYALSSQLRATSYPFLAVLICQSERAVQVADRISGELWCSEK